MLDHELRVLDSNKTENLCKYKDKVILAVNVASRCGFTYQYESLQALYKEYAERDFVILGFPSRDFMFQEFSDEGDVKEFCSTNYGVTFPLLLLPQALQEAKLIPSTSKLWKNQVLNQFGTSLNILFRKKEK